MERPQAEILRLHTRSLTKMTDDLRRKKKYEHNFAI